MSLPIVNTLPVHELELKVLGKTVRFKPFTVAQEKAILMAIEGDNTNDIINNYIEILKNCLIDEIDFTDLSLVDFVNLIVTLRSKSKGELLEFPRKCKKCEREFESTTVIEDAIQYKNIENTKSIIKINADLTFELRPLSYSFLYNLEKCKEEIDLYIHTAAHSVSKMIYVKKIFKIEDIEEFKEKIISNLTEKNLADIFKKCKDFVTLYFDIVFKCPYCGEEERLNVDNFLALLR